MNIKNKGFTLVELLGVIIILSLIMLLVFPKIVNSIKNSSKNTDKLEEELIYNAAKLYINKYKDNYPKNDGNVYCIAVKDLVDENYLTGPVTFSDGEDISDLKTIEVSYSGGFEYVLKDNSECVEKTNVLNPQGTYLMQVEGALSDYESTFLKGTLKRNQVETVTITNTKTPSSDAINSWDVSEAKDGSVIAWYTDTNSNNLYEVYIGGEGGVKANPNSSYLFASLNNATTIDVTYLDTSEVTNMTRMFAVFTSGSVTQGQTKLTNIIGTENLNTSHVTIMSEMFRCTDLVSLDISNFNTSQVVDMSSMFSGCVSLTEIIFPNKFNTSNVTTMSNMFYCCSKLENFEILNTFDTSNVTSMSNMFYRCYKLASLDVSNWNTGKVTNMQAMFGQSGIKEIVGIENLDISNVTTMRNMFYYCNGLTILDLSHWNTNKLTDVYNMFQYCRNLAELKINNAIFTNVINYNNMFQFATALKTIYVKDTTAQTFINARLTDANLTGVTVTIA